VEELERARLSNVALVTRFADRARRKEAGILSWPD
jgi:hypothetical protein